jgi:bacillithiol biosynthesis deacetylase BshB1
MKLDILAIGAHPDDVELSCSGTLAKHIFLGQKVGILDLTRGELGTRGSAELRSEEAAKAAQILGIHVRENLNFADGFFSNTEEHQLQLIKQIRNYQPDIVLCNAIYDRHPDHGKGSELVSNACFYSGLIKIETELNGKKQNAWRPKFVYHYIQDRYIKPDFIVDISEHIEVKMNSILAFGSQFFDPNSREPQTPISSKQFIEAIRNRSAEMGRIIGVDYGEGFTCERIAGVEQLNKLI